MELKRVSLFIRVISASIQQVLRLNGAFCSVCVCVLTHGGC